MTDDRIEQARRRLLDLRRGPGVWGYRLRSTPAVEPSVLAALGLLADGDEATALATARWLASIRRADGSLGVTVNLPEPGWPTPLAVLLWAAVEGFETERSAALGWLLALEGGTFRKGVDNPLGHDTSIVGWPWVAGTHSWVEPTAISLLCSAERGGLTTRGPCKGFGCSSTGPSPAAAGTSATRSSSALRSDPCQDRRAWP